MPRDRERRGVGVACTRVTYYSGHPFKSPKLAASRSTTASCSTNTRPQATHGPRWQRIQFTARHWALHAFATPLSSAPGAYSTHSSRSVTYHNAMCRHACGGVCAGSRMRVGF